MTAVSVGEDDMLDVRRHPAYALYFVQDIAGIGIIERVDNDQPVAVIDDNRFAEPRFEIAPFGGSDIIDTRCNLHINSCSCGVGVGGGG